ncbi:MAG: hypothetical protein U9P14_11615, partial [Gemmatimonadota bacterium]|nr:hypothetical protein [Gemmatimonadota bacterium]
LELPEEQGVLFRLENRLEWPYPGTVVFAISVDRRLEVDSTSLDNFGEVAGVVPGAELLRDVWFACRLRTADEIRRALEDGEDLWRLTTLVQAENRPRIVAAPAPQIEAAVSPGADTAEKPHTVSLSSAGRESKLRALAVGYFRGDGVGAIELWVLLLAAFVYGCFHALTPGHAKTVTAAYLVGSRGTYTHALYLALTVTLTHTGSILLLAAITKLAYGQAVDTTAQAVLSGVSGLLVLVFGILRLKGTGGGGTHVHGPGGHGHSHLHHEHSHHCDDHEHTHDGLSEEGKKAGVKKGRLEVLWLGLAGGLMPCPGALWIYLLALGFGRPGLGVVLIIFLSAGLALVLVAVGLASVGVRDLIKVSDGSQSVADAGRITRGSLGRLKSIGTVVVRLLPGITGTLLVVLGSFLLWRSLAEVGWIG